MQTAPCGWQISYAGCEDMCDALSSLPASGVEAFEQMAAAYLWNWTGRLFGECEFAIRPCKQECWGDTSTFWGSGPFPGLYGSWGGAAGVARPALIGGLWYNLTCGTCGDRCSCSHTPQIELPGPVSSVTQVLIDGEVLDPAAYRVDNAQLLVRVDGERWPFCQHMALPPTDEGTWEVTFKRGGPVPVGGQIAAGVLACALAKAACSSACELPQRVQEITRQGVSMVMIDPFDGLDNGRTGIWLIDSWVSSVTAAPKPWGVYSPDVPNNRVRRTTWTPS